MPDSAEPPPRAVERRAQRRSPGRRLAGVMDLVEHHERRAREVVREQVGRRRHLLIGDDHAVDVRAPCTVGVAPARIEMQPDAVRGVRPLRAQRRRRAHDDHLLAAGRADRLARSERLARARASPPAGSPRASAAACCARKAACQRSRRDRHAGRAALDEVAARAQRPPVRGLGGAAGAHRRHVVGVPAALERRAALRAPPTSREEQRDARGRSEPPGGHGPQSRMPSGRSSRARSVLAGVHTRAP